MNLVSSHTHMRSGDLLSRDFLTRTGVRDCCIEVRGYWHLTFNTCKYVPLQRSTGQSTGEGVSLCSGDVVLLSRVRYIIYTLDIMLYE